MAALPWAYLILLLLVHHIVSFFQLKFIYDYSFPPASLPSGDSAVNVKSVCPKEMVTLRCPEVEQAILSGEYGTLFWEVFDPRNKTQLKQPIVFCNENFFCISYGIGIYDKRIKVTERDDLVMGILHVEQLIENDLLTFVCSARKRYGNYPVVYEVNISSITCKYDLNDYLIYISVLSGLSLSFLLTPTYVYQFTC